MKTFCLNVANVTWSFVSDLCWTTYCLFFVGHWLKLESFIVRHWPWSLLNSQLTSFRTTSAKKMIFQVVFIVSWFCLWDFEFRTLAWVSSNHGPMLHVTRFWTSTAIERYTTLVCYERCSCTWGDKICAGPQRATISYHQQNHVYKDFIFVRYRQSQIIPKNGVRSSATRILSSSLSCFP